MRIVHEVTVPMSPSGGFNGEHHAEVTAVEASPKDHPDVPAGMFGSGEYIEIEGDPRYLIKLLEDWLMCLRSCQKKMEEEKKELAP